MPAAASRVRSQSSATTPLRKFLIGHVLGVIQSSTVRAPRISGLGATRASQSISPSMKSRFLRIAADVNSRSEPRSAVVF